MANREFTPNELVSINLRKARTLRGWTQDQAAERLEPYLGARWSKASYSAAERAWEVDRVRRFGADELYAFARAFELPVTFFLMPQAGGVDTVAHPDAPDAAMPAEDFADLLFTLDAATAARLTDVYEPLGLREELAALKRYKDAAERAHRAVERRIEEVLAVAESLRDVTDES